MYHLHNIQYKALNIDNVWRSEPPHGSPGLRGPGCPRPSDHLYILIQEGWVITGHTYKMYALIGNLASRDGVTWVTTWWVKYKMVLFAN